MPPLTTNDIVSHLNKNYPLKGYKYSVQIFGGGSQPDASEELMLNCSAVNVPGLNIGFSTFKKFGIGSVHNVPIGRSFTELNLTFYESDGEPERKYFVDWQDKIYDKNTLRFGYYKDIVKTLLITQYDKKNQATYSCKVIDCFPSNLSPLDKAYSAEGVMQMNVNIQFYQVEEIFFNKVEGYNPFSFF